MVLSAGSPSMNPRGQLSVPGSPPSPCTRNLKEGPKEKRKVHTHSLAATAAVQESCFELRSSNTFMQHTQAVSREHAWDLCHRQKTGMKTGSWMPLRAGTGCTVSPHPQLCERDDPFMPVLVNPEAAMLLL